MTQYIETLTMNEIEEVNGGAAPVIVGVIIVVGWACSQWCDDLANGFVDGLIGNPDASDPDHTHEE